MPDLSLGPLASALGLDRPQVTAIVGSGGKTTLLNALAGELAARGRWVAATTTTHFYPPPAGLFPELWLWGQKIPSPEQITRRLRAGRPLAVAAEKTLEGKLQGLSPEQVEVLARIPDLFVMVEADGAAGRPLKAWAAWEPVIPAKTGLLVVMAGASGLGRPLGPAWVHRPELFSRAAGLGLGEPVTPEALASVLLGPEGPLRAKPAGCRAVLLVNQADTASQTQMRAMQTALTVREGAKAPFAKMLAGRLRWHGLGEM